MVVAGAMLRARRKRQAQTSSHGPDAGSGADRSQNRAAHLAAALQIGSFPRLRVERSSGPETFANGTVGRPNLSARTAQTLFVIVSKPDHALGNGGRSMRLRTSDSSECWWC